MRTTHTFLLSIAFFSLIGCSPEIEDSITNHEPSVVEVNYLIGDWMVEAHSLYLVKSENPESAETLDLFASYDDCKQSEITTFKSGGTFTKKQERICEKTNIAPAGTWRFNSDRSGVVLKSSGQSAYYDIELLTEYRLILSKPIYNKGQRFIDRLVYKRS